MAHSGFKNAIDAWTREAIINEYCWANTELFASPSKEVREDAEKFYEKLVEDDKVNDFLKAMAPNPCPTCGHAR